MIPPRAPAPAPPDPERCALTGEVLSRVGDRWSMLVVMTLGDGSRRFNELKRAVRGVTPRMLTLTLRGLERDGLVARAVTGSVPPRVDYRLTPLGRSLRGPVEALGDWAVAQHEAVRAARAAYDAEGPDPSAG